MRRISSKLSWIYRRLLPVVVLTFFSILLVLFFPLELFSRDVPWFVPLIPIGFIAVILLIFCFLWYPLVDAVDLADDGIFVKKGSQEEQIPFERIDRVSEIFVNPEIVAVRLKSSDRFGTDFHFLVAPQRWFWQMFVPHPVVAELRDRIRQKTNSPDGT